MSTFQPEYQRVRKGIYSIIQKKTADDLKMPTEYELCRIFDVGRTTIRRAIKQLTDEGILTARPGMGTYVSTVSRTEQAQTGQMRRFAYTHNSGQMTTFWRENALKFMPILDYLTHNGCILDFMTFPATGKDTVKELQHNNIEGMFWAGPCENQIKTIEAIKDAGIKLILTECYPWEGFNIIGTDGFKQGYMAAEYLLKQGCKNPLHITYNPDEPVYRWKHEGFRKALKKSKNTDIYEKAICCEELEQLLKYRGKIDGIFCQGGKLEAIKGILEAHGLRVPDDCKIISTNTNAGFPALTEPLLANGKLAAEKMLGLFRKKTKKPFHILTPPQFIDTPVKQ